MKLEKGELITLSDGKEYAVIDTCNINNTIYVYIMTTDQPLEMAIVKESIDADGKVNLVTVNDREEALNVLNAIAHKPVTE